MLNFLGNKLTPNKADTVSRLAANGIRQAARTPSPDIARHIAFAACAFGRTSPGPGRKSPLCMTHTFFATLQAIRDCKNKARKSS